MSLFDVLKYPLSNPPTIAELEAIPSEIFELLHSRSEYLQMYGYFVKGKLKEQYIDDVRISIEYRNAQVYKADIELLRSIIQEYNVE